MKYPLHFLSDDQFEALVGRICYEILGTGVVVFTKGRDGGKDGRFEGTANHYPSDKSPWFGKFIIQAKHTNNPIASCSDSDFETQVGKEILRLKKLIAKVEVIDNYLLFTNRKYTGDKGEKLRDRVVNETGIKNVNIIGIEVLNDNYLKPNRQIVKDFSLDKMVMPFDFSDSEIRSVIVELKKQLDESRDDLKDTVEGIEYDFNRIELADKNKKNELGKEYFEDEILANSLEHFHSIDEFLKSPKNSEFKEQYYDSAAELRNMISIKRDNFGPFEEVLASIYQIVCEGKEELKGKRYVWVLLHYMYFTCAIGKK